MAKRKIDEEQRKKEQEQLDAYLKQLEDKDNLTKEEYDNITKEIWELVKNNRISRFAVILAGIIKFIISAALLYLISICVTGLFYSTIVIENKYMVFAVVGIVTGVLMLFRIIYNNFVALKLKHPFMVYGVLIIIIGLVGALMNNYVYCYFNNPYLWIIYILLIMLLNGAIYIKSLKRKMGL